MFEMRYRVAKSKGDYIDFLGDKGYYQMIYNRNVYGVMFPEEIEENIGTELLFIWFMHITEVAIELHSKTYLVLSDHDSPGSLEFEKKGDTLDIREVLSDESSSKKIIEDKLYKPIYRIPKDSNTSVLFQDFKQEIIEKCTSYLKDISKLEQNDYGKAQIANLEEKLKYLKSL